MLIITPIASCRLSAHGSMPSTADSGVPVFANTASSLARVCAGSASLSLRPSSKAKLCCIFARFSGFIMSSMSSSKITVFASRSAASTSVDSG